MPTRLVIHWRGSSSLETHRELLRILAEKHSYQILHLVEATDPPGKDSPGINHFTVHGRLRFHPTVRILTGWKEMVSEFQPDVFLGLDEPYCIQTAIFHSWCKNRSVPFLFYSAQNIDRALPPPFGWIERRVLSNAQAAWFLSEDVAVRCRRRGFEGAGSVIPLGVDPSRFARTENVPSITHREPFTVGYIGRLVPEKGVSDLIGACAQAGVRLLVAGAGPDRTHLERLANQEGGTVEWLGEIPEDNVPAVLHQMDVLVLPSRTTRTWREQFGRVLVEAMAAGVPVIGSDSGEIPRTIGDAGLIFPEGDINILSDHIMQLRDSLEFTDKIKDMALDRVIGQFTWDCVAVKLDAIIRKVLHP